MNQPQQRIAQSAATEIHELCSEYRSQGWRVDGDEQTGQIALTVGDHVNVVSMPAELGKRVHQILSIHMLAGPVLGYAAEGRWTFITEPGLHPDRLPDDVVAENVTGSRPGIRLRLPANRRGFGGVRWIAHPEAGRSAPPWQAVISAARRALSEELLERTA